MKNLNYFTVFVLLTLTFILINDATAQRHAMKGYSIPVDKPVRIMTVFVQVDDENCSYDLSSETWPYGELPVFADTLFDHEMYPDGQQNGPQAYLSKYYYEASYGQHYVTGDYLDHVIYVSVREPSRIRLGFKLYLQLS